MGVFGEYEDDNDNVFDIFYDIVNRIMPKNIIKGKEGEELYNIREKYVKDNKDKLLKEVNKWIIRHKKDRKLYNKEMWYYNAIVGIIIMMIKKYNKNKLPKKITQTMIPATLRKIALDNIVKIIKTDNISEWKDPTKRLNALKKELKLFSNNKIKIKDIIKK